MLQLPNGEWSDKYDVRFSMDLIADKATQQQGRLVEKEELSDVNFNGELVFMEENTAQDVAGWKEDSKGKAQQGANEEAFDFSEKQKEAELSQGSDKIHYITEINTFDDLATSKSCFRTDDTDEGGVRCEMDEPAEDLMLQPALDEERFYDFFQIMAEKISARRKELAKKVIEEELEALLVEEDVFLEATPASDSAEEKNTNIEEGETVWTCPVHFSNVDVYPDSDRIYKLMEHTMTAISHKPHL